MIEVFEAIWGQIVAAGIPVATIGFFFWVWKRYIDRRDEEQRAAIAKREKERTERERLLEEEKKQEAAELALKVEERQKEVESREDMKLSLAIKQTTGIMAAITLGIATAEALRDGRCNGNVTSALIRGADAKADIDSFLLQRGLHNVRDDIKD